MTFSFFSPHILLSNFFFLQNSQGFNILKLFSLCWCCYCCLKSCDNDSFMSFFFLLLVFLPPDIDYWWCLSSNFIYRNTNWIWTFFWILLFCLFVNLIFFSHKIFSMIIETFSFFDGKNIRMKNIQKKTFEKKNIRNHFCSLARSPKYHFWLKCKYFCFFPGLFVCLIFFILINNNNNLQYTGSI